LVLQSWDIGQSDTIPEISHFWSGIKWLISGMDFDQRLAELCI
jgi:hypothetical protein